MTALPLAIYGAQAAPVIGDCLKGSPSCHAPRCEKPGFRWTAACIARALRTTVRGSLPGAIAIQAGQSITVRDDAQLKRAIAGASAGATIGLASGRYAPVIIRDRRFADRPLLITSVDPAKPALLSGLVVRDSAGIGFRDLAFDGTGAKQQYGMLVMGSRRIAIDRARFDDPRGLRTTFSALMIRNSEDVTLRGSRFTRFWQGVSLLSGRNITISGNAFENIQTDGIRGGGVSDLLIEGNICRAFRPQPKDHPDCVQLWSTQQTESARNIVIRNNLVVRGDGAATQGIFVRDTFRKLPFYNVEISGNLVIGGMYNGIAAHGLRDSRVFGNEVIAEKDQKSWIRLVESDDVQLHDNRAMTFLITEKNGTIDSRRNTVTAWSAKGADRRLQQWLANRPQFADDRGPTFDAVLQQYPAAR
jgi:hypothetical protein